MSRVGGLTESILDLPKLDWAFRATEGQRSLKSFYLTDGDIIIWKDDSEVTKELTKEEDEDIKTNEAKKRKAVASSLSTYTYKEKHLVIKQTDVDV